MGARGNSGVIFSQIVRGFVEGLGQTEELTASDLSRAFRSASDAAYRAVKRPVEGTMLTVIREMADEGEKKEHRKLSAAELLGVVLARGEDALARTPTMLDVLADAGVVDAGGAGLVEIVRGIALDTTGEPLPEVAVESDPLSVDAVHLERSKYRYCTVFVVEGDELDHTLLETALEQMGDSLLVVGDESALKVHVHTDDPGAALSAGIAMGTVEGVEIANMHHQTAAREERLLGGGRPAADARDGSRRGLPGAGKPTTLREPRRDASHRGRSDHESVDADLVEAIDSTPAAEVIVLPNNSNVDPDGPAGRRAVVEAGPSRACPLRPGRSRGDRTLRAHELTGPERGGHARRGRVGRDRRGDRGVARRGARRHLDSQGRIPRARRREAPWPRTTTW